MYPSFTAGSTTSAIPIPGTHDPSLLRLRYYNPNLGTFTSFDDFEAAVDEPMHLHKYNYAGGDPVNNTDPSGKDWTLTSALVTGGIIGGTLGLIGGYSYGVYKTGRIFSLDNVKYALVGTAFGAALGAGIGGGIYFAATAGFSLWARSGVAHWLSAVVDQGTQSRRAHHDGDCCTHWLCHGFFGWRSRSKLRRHCRISVDDGDASLRRRADSRNDLAEKRAHRFGRYDP
jgi:hypothetical protein